MSQEVLGWVVWTFFEYRAKTIFLVERFYYLYAHKQMYSVYWLRNDILKYFK